MPERRVNENQAVEAYLQYLSTGTLPAPVNGHELDLEVLNTQIAAEPELHRKVVLIAKRQALLNPPKPDARPVIQRFIDYAGTFSERTGVTYPVWREMGVPPAVLKQAGIPVTHVPGSHKPGEGKALGRPKMPLDDPNRQRAYGPRRKFTPEFLAEFVAYYDAHGKEATAEKYNYKPGYCKQVVNKYRQGLYG